MKLKAIEKIKPLNNKQTLKNILTKLDKSENKSELKVYNLSQHFESISKRYDETKSAIARLFQTFDGRCAMVAVLEENGFLFSADEKDFYDFVISISTGEKKFDKVLIG